MIAITEDANPPLHLVLGEWGYDAVVKKLKASLAEVEAHRETALATDFPRERGLTLTRILVSQAA